MARRVLTGCRDCRKCMASNAVVGSRNLMRVMAFTLTGGGSEVGLGLMAK